MLKEILTLTFVIPTVALFLVAINMLIYAVFALPSEEDQAELLVIACIKIGLLLLIANLNLIIIYLGVAYYLGG